jgi:hypothetical protein
MTYHGKTRGSSSNDGSATGTGKRPTAGSDWLFYPVLVSG